MVWNRQQKRDTFGQRQDTKRPASEWLTVDAPQLRIVTDAEWRAAHQRLQATAATYARVSSGHVLGRPSTGCEARHLLTRIAECALCHGGFMRRQGGRLANGRRLEYYICTGRNNHGETACTNNVPLPLRLADEAVLSTLSDYVLRPDIIEGAILDAVALLRPSADTLEAQRLALEKQLRAAKEEAARLAEALARAGNLDALLDALRDRERQQARLRQQLDGLDGLRTVTDFDVRQVERDLRARLKEWKALLQRQTSISRQIVTKLVDGHLVFTPREDRTYEFAGKAHLGKLLQGIVLPQVFDRFTDTTAQEAVRDVILAAYGEVEAATPAGQ
jgi:hypothetical protein